MKIYLAHNFEARDWLRNEVKPMFEDVGIEITSTWLDIEAVAKFGDTGNANRDMNDICRSDYVILFASDWEFNKGKGKWFEFGYAVALGVQVLVIGNNDCIFLEQDKYSNVIKYNSLWEAFLYLTRQFPLFGSNAPIKQT